MTPTPEELAGVLVQLGCPADRSVEMARQLDRRAHQLAEAKGRTHAEALTHLLQLMAGGWAAQAAGIPTPGVVSPTVDSCSKETEPAAGPSQASVQPWLRKSSTPVADHRIFRIRSDRKVHPRHGTEHDFLAIESVDWVNVIAITREGFLVMIDQFRHGTNTVELEIPGGMMDPDESDPVAAGLRELREETGYEGDSALLLGSIFPNPAVQTNTCHTVLVKNCVQRHALELDPGEDLATRLIPLSEIPSLLRDGRVRHALVVVALAYYLHRQQ
jgi:8-oxo-dGTP pyrophosphatase MutT (NUDIX family)